MKYAQLRTMDIANGEGIRVSLFTSGCTHACPGCFNQAYQSFSYGQEMTMDIVDRIKEELNKDYVAGLTLLGGEPFQAQGLEAYLRPIREEIDRLNEMGAKKAHRQAYAKKDIWIYSGYTFEELMEDESKVRLLALCDVLVDGLFKEELKDLRLRFRGSSNQRILDVQASLKEGKAKGSASSY